MNSNLVRRSNETNKQFEFRKKIYMDVLNDSHDEEKALRYSNIWVNILSMNCSYPEEVMKLVEKYKPSDKDNIYLIK